MTDSKAPNSTQCITRTSRSRWPSVSSPKRVVFWCERTALRRKVVVALSFSADICGGTPCRKPSFGPATRARRWWCTFAGRPLMTASARVLARTNSGLECLEALTCRADSARANFFALSESFRIRKGRSFSCIDRLRAIPRNRVTLGSSVVNSKASPLLFASGGGRAGSGASAPGCCDEAPHPILRDAPRTARTYGGWFGRDRVRKRCGLAGWACRRCCW
mmetsp:Transcript_36919/g.101897  ORF Transcript_36919/g.101897 Transcript_36919/m.101897 type:complete len:220 (-) Transcript_36919:30-689(-)